MDRPNSSLGSSLPQCGRRWCPQNPKPCHSNQACPPPSSSRACLSSSRPFAHWKDPGGVENNRVGTRPARKAIQRAKPLIFRRATTWATHLRAQDNHLPCCVYPCPQGHPPIRRRRLQRSAPAPPGLRSLPPARGTQREGSNRSFLALETPK